MLSLAPEELMEGLWCQVVRVDHEVAPQAEKSQAWCLSIVIYQVSSCCLQPGQEKRKLESDRMGAIRAIYRQNKVGSEAAARPGTFSISSNDCTPYPI